MSYSLYLFALNAKYCWPKVTRPNNKIIASSVFLNWMILLNYFDFPSTQYLGTLCVKTSNHVGTSCFGHLPSHCGDWSRNRGKKRSLNISLLVVCPLIDDKEVPKCGKVSDTYISLYYLIHVADNHSIRWDTNAIESSLTDGCESGECIDLGITKRKKQREKNIDNGQLKEEQDQFGHRQQQ